MAAVSAAALLALVGCSATPSTPASAKPAVVEHVTMTIPFAGALYVLPYFAEENGYFKKAGVDVSVSLVASQQATSGLIGGSIQFELSGAPGPDVAALQGPVKVLATYSEKADAQLVARPGNPTVASLKGKTIGISAPGALADIFAREALADANVPVSEVTLRPMGAPNAAVAAFESGQIDAVVLSQPTVNTVLAAVKGSSIVENFTDKIPWTSGGVYANTNWVKGHPDATLKVLEGLNAALKGWRSDPKAAEATLKKDAASTDPAFDYKHTLTVMTKTLQPLTAKTQVGVLTAMKENGQPTVNPKDWKKYVDNSFVNKLK